MATDASGLPTLLPLQAVPLSCAPGDFWSPDDDQALRCIDVRAETHDVRTFTFAAANGRCFGVRPGQFFRFELTLDGEAFSRCYSVTSSALAPRTVAITVKRVAGGRVSNWLHDHVVPGTVLNAAGPAGVFTLDETAAGPYLFASGGSGITPLMGMLRTLADARRHPDIVFLHAGRTPADLIFRDELLWRARVTPGLRLVFLPERTEPGDVHLGPVGRLSEALLQVMVPDLAGRTVMCCGPAPFMDAVRRHSLALGVPPARYLEESFGGSGEPAAAPSTPVLSSVAAPIVTTAATATTTAMPPAPAPVPAPSPVPATASPAPLPAAAPAEPSAAAAGSAFSVRFTKQGRELQVPAGQTVLAAARQGGISLPSSCANGVCGTCKSRLVSGQVDMQHNGGIRPREVTAGFFLPCCSRPLSDLEIER